VAVVALKEALLVKAAERELLRTDFPARVQAAPCARTSEDHEHTRG
jgi:hypothetical protein